MFLQNFTTWCAEACRENPGLRLHRTPNTARARYLEADSISALPFQAGCRGWITARASQLFQHLLITRLSQWNWTARPGVV